MAWLTIVEVFSMPGIQKTSPAIFETRSLTIPPEAKKRDRPKPARQSEPGDSTHKVIPPVAALQSAAIKVDIPTKPATQPATTTLKNIKITEHPLSKKQRAQQAYQGAVRDVRSGNIDAAVLQLEHLLDLDSRHHQARVLLASLYIQLERLVRAEEILATGLADTPGHAPFAKLYAQLLLAESRDSEAIDYLQRALPDASQDADYHALLAGIYQRTGETVTAAQYYQTALKLSPKHGEWWMGLGISQEQSGSTEAAQESYQRALKYPLTAVLQEYVTKRVESLSR
jgi:MSHA biogenesis protein MshN